MKSWLRLQVDLKEKKMEKNLANTPKSIEIQRMTSQTEMRMVDSSMFTLTEQPLM